MSSNQEKQAKVKVSKSLSYLLRHGAVKERLAIDEKGFIKISDILQHRRLSSLRATQPQVLAIVKECPKQRFFVEDRDGVLYIRANQGHSLQNVSVDMQQLTLDDLPDVVVHGTYLKLWNLIKQSGLSKMSRQHIHLCAGEPDSEKVISGVRQTVNLLIYIDAKKAIEDGIVFYRSANNVILTNGVDGILSPKYFSAVRTKDGRDLLKEPVS